LLFLTVTANFLRYIVKFSIEILVLFYGNLKVDELLTMLCLFKWLLSFICFPRLWAFEYVGNNEVISCMRVRLTFYANCVCGSVTGMGKVTCSHRLPVTCIIRISGLANLLEMACYACDVHSLFLVKSPQNDQRFHSANNVIFVS